MESGLKFDHLCSHQIFVMSSYRNLNKLIPNTLNFLFGVLSQTTKIVCVNVLCILNSKYELSFLLLN